jgi:hypothetical protein
MPQLRGNEPILGLYALANCSLLRLPIPKSLIKNELYVDNFTVNIQHSRPVEENVEVEGDAW